MFKPKLIVSTPSHFKILTRKFYIKQEHSYCKRCQVELPFAQVKLVLN